ncbi:TIR domain-containing protein [uncultured Methylovirgula sp.]|uniref:TIR domain-containing protein n=1 Tax=uncultured Methylovirgula sp. TaxID=1285960 RepID=UPI002614B1D0|nr:TIR domain-containing protein [uncultured Methylovirgula sp.]
MAKISPALLVLLQKRMGAKLRTVYAAIQRTAVANRVTNDLGALLLAGEHGISYSRYATREQMEALRVAPSPAPPPASTPKDAVRAPSRKAPAAKKQIAPDNNSIFVVHGRDSDLAADLFAFLRAIGLHPLEWSQATRAAKGANPHVDDIIKKSMETVRGVLVLFSPDEEAKLKKKFCSGADLRKGVGNLQGQSRPNVIFEAGLALGAHSEKTILVQVGEVREISDIAGKHLVSLSNDPEDRKELAHRLKSKLKFNVDLSGGHWLTQGNFDR